MGWPSRTSLHVLVAAFLCTFHAQNAFAQEGPRFSVSPRLYLTWISGGDEPLVMPLFGVSASTSVSSRWDATFTTLYGEANNQSVDGTANENKRFDFELLARYRIPQSPVYLVGGYRNINIRSKHYDTSGSYLGSAKINLYLGELGAGFATRISKSGRHAMFGNMTLGYGIQKEAQSGFSGPDQSSSRGSFLIDTNLGYQYAIERWLAVSARYRMIAVTSTYDGDTHQNFVFGPEVAVTFRF